MSCQDVIYSRRSRCAADIGYLQCMVAQHDEASTVMLMAK